MLNSLDQAQDPLAGFYKKTVEAYDAYQVGDYQKNFERLGLWEKHYEHMRTRFADFMLHKIEGGAKRNRAAIAIVGPGVDPARRDFDKRIVDDYFSRFRSIVLVDFSVKTIRAAIKSLVDSGVSPDNILGMQYDITDGFSTVYDQYIQEQLVRAVSEEELSRATERFSSLSMKELDERLKDERQKWNGVFCGIDEIPGKLNAQRSLKLTVDGEELPLDFVSYQMVLAGTGAASEGRIWEKFAELTRGDEEPSEAVLEDRRKMVERIHGMVSRYNTAVAFRSVRKFLQENPQAKLLAISDVSTIHEEPRFGALPRLNESALKGALTRANIVTTIPDVEWRWKDEPGHGHGVKAYEFHRNGHGPH